jgi:hypothetical protein
MPLAAFLFSLLWYQGRISAKKGFGKKVCTHDRITRIGCRDLLRVTRWDTPLSSFIDTAVVSNANMNFTLLLGLCFSAKVCALPLQ